MPLRSIVVFIILGMFTWISCGNNYSQEKIILSESDLSTINNIKLLSVEKGQKMLALNCFACHNPKAESHDNMLAPPLAGIKWRYTQSYTDRNSFISAMTDFIHQPTKSKALMRGPVRRFGLMPVTTLNKAQIMQITAFIYDNKIEEPQWFAKHFEDQHDTKWEN